MPATSKGAEDPAHNTDGSNNYQSLSTYSHSKIRAETLFHLTRPLRYNRLMNPFQKRAYETSVKTLHP